MNGSLKIKHTGKTLEERGLRADSFFTLHLEDGSTHSEHTMNWSEHSSEALVGYFGGVKRVHLGTLPMRRITVRHGALEAVLEVPAGHQVYQAVRSETIFSKGGTTRIVGRVVGLVKDGEVVEERFLNEPENTVVGLKK